MIGPASETGANKNCMQLYRNVATISETYRRLFCLVPRYMWNL